MNTIARVVSTISTLYSEINPSTLSGAIDIIVIEHPDGTLHCSPFHIRFGKMHLLRPQDKHVEVKVNGKSTNLLMKVGEAGEAFFVMETKVCFLWFYETKCVATRFTKRIADKSLRPSSYN